ncbi:MAG: hypothetical protein GY725_21890 [bacterium]|nr:hypothetical protein [bacterium]
MLSKMDDYPIHQTSEPVAHPASSDRHVYDRYWFNGYQDDGAFYFAVAAALYPNLETMDCAVSIVIDGEQHSFHASRRAPQEPTDLSIGPWKLDIQEPMKRLKITLVDNETGISGELQWIPRTANIEEGHQLSRRRVGRMEATRFNQFGRWEGEIRYDGKTVQVDPRRVHGTKDRSWGIRPVGDPAPVGAPPTTPGGIFFLWAPLHWEDRCTHLGLFENEHGVRWHTDGMICPVYEDPDDIPGTEDPATEFLAGGEHHLSFVSGTRRASAAEITLLKADGKREDIRLDPVLCFRMKGIGYLHPEWGHGRWKGELVIGGEKWKCADLDENALENQHIQQVVMATSGDQKGIGVLEQIHLGPHPRYGFKSLLDPAR